MDAALEEGKLWPEPLLHLNPAFEDAGRMEELAEQGLMHPDCADIFKGYRLYRHQREAISRGLKEQSFVVTSGTGSGKSLTYIGTIFNHLLEKGPSATPGVVAVVVYPLNALVNSQENELKGYAENFEAARGVPFSIRFAKFTGQEGQEERQAISENPPHILLTNYMMLELLLTRVGKGGTATGLREALFENLRFVVFDELHTYRGRQGADVGDVDPPHQGKIGQRPGAGLCWNLRHHVLRRNSGRPAQSRGESSLRSLWYALCRGCCHSGISYPEIHGTLR